MNKKKINLYIKDMFNRAHRIVLGSDAGENMQRFVKNVSVSFTGGLSAFVMLFFASVIVARILGPAEYGKYSVFFSIAQLMSLLFVLELDVSALYFLSQKTGQKNTIFSSIVVMFFLNIVIFSFVALSVYHFFDFENISLPIFMGMIVMGLTFAFKRMIDAFLRTEGKFKTQSILRVFEAASVLSMIGVFFYFLEYKVYFSYVISVVFGGLLFSILGAWFLRKIFVLQRSDVKKINEIFHYNSYGMINAFVNGIVKNIDKILIASLLGVGAVGLYAVYFTASVVIGARITQIFMNVFFPSVRGNVKNSAKVYKKINMIFVRLFFPLVLCASGGVALIIWLYGNEYQFVWLWVLLGGAYIAVHFFASLYGWLLSSISQKGYKFYNVSFLYGAVGYGSVLFFALMMDMFTVTAFFVALIMYRAISGIFSYCAVRDRV